MVKQVRIGIVTFTHGANYGCYLQRYATQEILGLLGVSAQCLLFTPKNKNKNTWRQKVMKGLFNPKFLGMFLVKRLENQVNKFNGSIERRGKVFANFRDLFLKSTQKLATYEELKQLNFDAYIAGSDQIWNTAWMPTEEFFRYYMLDFAPSDKKIAYAPSIGVSKITDEFAPKFQRYLADFRFLSARENEGAQELERLLNRPVEVVLDPTMLLTTQEWDEVAAQARPVKTQRYILCYSLGNGDKVLRKATALQKKLKCPIVFFEDNFKTDLKLRLKGKNIIFARSAGPAEFVNYIKNASCVVTDSFHGSVFAILYRKPFFTMMRDTKSAEKSMNSRMSTLFSTFRLESRLFEPNSDEPVTDESFKIDYDAVEAILQKRRAESLNYLKNALETVTGQKIDA